MNIRHLLLVHGGHAGGRTAQLRAAVRAGISAGTAAVRAEAADAAVELRELPALQAGIDDLLWADGLLLGTPEHFGYMSGALKDFFDRTFYPAEGRTEGKPYALFISAGNDGTGTAAAVARIASGYRWHAIAPPLLVVGEPSPADLARCEELGATMAAGLAAGVL
jgi:multimeric flavodoxin WrbA